jgi:hypothetical protein
LIRGWLPPLVTRLPVSRRTFIGGLIGAAVSDGYAIADEDLTIERIAADTNELRIQYRGLSTDILHADLGQDAQISIRSDPNGGRHSITVRRVVGPLVNPFALALRFVRSSTGNWTVAAETRGWPVSDTIKFDAVPCDAWLSSLRAPATVVGLSDRLVRALRLVGVTAEYSEIRVALNRDFSWSLLSRGNAFRIFAGGALIKELHLKRLVAAPEPCRPADSSGSGGIAAWGDAEISADTMRFGDAGSSFVLVHGPKRGAFRAHAPDGRTNRLSSIKGGWSAEVHTDKVVEGKFLSNDGSWQEHETVDRTIRALRLPFPPKPFVVKTRAGEFVLHGDEEADDQWACSDVGLFIEARDGRLTKFTGHGLLTHASNSVAGADYSRLDFESAPLSFALSALPAPTAFGDRGVVTLGEKPNLDMPLDRGTLRVVRGADLVSLRYGFRGLSLDFDGKAVKLKVTSLRAKDAVPADDEQKALMIVTLPPQHVAERAYFRRLETKATIAQAGQDGSAVDDRAPKDFPDVAMALPAGIEIDLASKPVELKQRKLELEKKKEAGDERYKEYRSLFEKSAAAYPDYRDEQYFGVADLRRRNDDKLYEIARKALSELQTNSKFAKDDLEPFDEITEARASGATRLAFRIDPQTAKQGIPFSVDGLTDWESFDLAVVRRAETVKDDPEHPGYGGVLKFQRIPAAPMAGVGLDWTERMTAIRATLTPPAPDQTAIELPFRLMLSPDQNARWRTPRSDVAQRAFEDGIVVPLWHAELEEGGPTSSVRAVWSPDFRPDVFYSADHTQVPLPPHGPYSPWLLGKSESDADAVESDANIPGRKQRFRTSLDAYDRHELVGLSSIFGLPTLGRLTDSGLLDGSQVAPPAGFVLSGLKPETVKGVERDIQALYLPRTLGVQELTLSALGGSIDLDARFEPPSPARLIDLKPRLFEAFSIERWRHATTLGRDVAVEVVYKGFLFPIGHRCTLVKVTDRRFFQNPVTGAPTAYLVQRMFIRVAQPEKKFPAIGQPFAGRAWPVTRMTILTRRTPDIVDPIGGNVAGGGDPDVQVSGGGRILLLENASSSAAVQASRQSLPGLIFWPRTSLDPNAPGAEIQFQVQFENAALAVQIPLIFVDNTAAHSPRTIGRLVDYYNRTLAKAQVAAPLEVQDIGEERLTRLATIDHGEVSRRFAPESRPGDASHVTRRWRLRAEGRELTLGEGASTGDEAYTMTGVMEGADQPPFYPAIHWAELRLKQIERMAGTAVAPVKASFHPDYLRKGLPLPGQTVNPKSAESYEIYMLLHQVVPADFGAGQAGDRVGGLAQPNFDAIALSRKHGLFGGAKPQPQERKPGATPVAPLRMNSSDIGKLRDTLKDLNPTKFFGDARILGLVSLTEVLQRVGDGVEAPVLQELVEYGVPAGQTTREFARSLLVTLRTTLDRFNEVVENVSPGYDSTEADGTRVAGLIKLYPDLHEAYRLAMAAVRDGEKSIGAAAQNPLELAQILSQIYESGRRLITAIERVAADPVGPIRDQAQQVFRNLREQLLGKAQDLFGITTATLEDEVRTAVASAETGMDAAVREFVKPTLDPTLETLYGVAGHLDKLIREELKAPDLDQALVDIVSADAEIETALSALVNRTLGTVIDQAQERCDDAARRLGDAVMAIGNPSAGSAATALDDLRLALGKISQQIAGLPNPGGQWRPWQEAVLDTHKTVVAAIGSDIASLVGALKELEDAVGALSGSYPRSCTTLAGQPLRGISDLKRRKDQFLSAAAASIAALRGDILAIEKPWTNVVHDLPNTAPADVASKMRDIEDGVARAIAEVNGLAAKLLVAGTALGATVPRSAGFLRSATDGLSEMERAARELHQVAQGAGSEELAKELQTAGDKVAELRQQGEGLRKLILAADGVKNQTAKATIPDAVERVRVLYTALEGIQTSVASAENALFDAFRDIVIALDDLYTPYVVRLVGPVKTAMGWVLTADRKIHGNRLEVLRTIADLSTAQPGNTAVEAMQTLVRVTSIGDHLKCLFAVSQNEKDGPLNDCSALISDSGGTTRIDDELTHEIEYLEKTIGVAGQKGTIDGDPLGVINSQEFKRTLRLWSGRRAPAVRIVNQVAQTAADLLRGDLQKLVPFETIRADIDRSIRQLIPSRIHLNYDFSTAVGDIGIFGMTGPSSKNDLVLKASTMIDVQTPGKPPEIKVTGYLQPFKLALFKPIASDLDIVTIQFARAQFNSVGGGKPNFNAQISKVELGDKVKFLQDLSQWMSPKEGSAFYIIPARDRPGIEAGYILDLGTISVGTISFINVRIGAGVILPFDKGDARFKISLSTRDSPFLISAAPYGGGGYLALIGNASRIVGFESAFEYGGVAAFSYGPLDAIGRLTSGIFVAKIENDTTLDGYFFAGGAGRIACFGFASSFTVSIGQQQGGSLAGSAVFSFAFSVGFLKAKFDITVWKQTAQGWANSAALERPSDTDYADRRRGDTPIQIAMNTIDMADVGPTGYGERLACTSDTSRKGGWMENKGVCQSQNWRTYQSYFDTTLL